MIHALERRAGHEQDGRAAASRCRSPTPRCSSATLAIRGDPAVFGLLLQGPDPGRRLHLGPSQWLWLIGIITAGLTAFYMFRLMFMTFHGDSRVDARQGQHVHESPPVMTDAADGAGRARGGRRMGRVCPTGCCGATRLTRFLAPVGWRYTPFVRKPRATPHQRVGRRRWRRRSSVSRSPTYFYITGARAARTHRCQRERALPVAAATSTTSTNSTTRLSRGRFLSGFRNTCWTAASTTCLIDGLVNGTGLDGRGRPARPRGARRPATFSMYAFVYLLGAVGIVAYYLYLVMVR